MTKHDDYDKFDTWCDQWEKAMKNGTFEAPPAAKSVNRQTANTNFFGVTNHNPSDKPSDPDGKYWNDLYSLSHEYASDSRVLDDYLSGDLQVMQEEVVVDVKKYTHSLANTPNPIRPNSVGMDQDIKNPISLGATYDVGDLEGLETLKTKLHNLLVKLNSMEGRSQTGSTKLESQIQSLQKQIDELSDNLCKSIPSQVGD